MTGASVAARAMAPVQGARELRRLFGAFPSGVVAVCGMGEAGPVGMSASSFTSVSLDPPLVSVCVAHSSSTWPLLRRMRHVGVSIFSHDQEHACRQLAAKSSDRFAGLDWQAVDQGAVFLNPASAWFECRFEDRLPAGDHEIVLLRVLRASRLEHPPLVFHSSRFRRLEHPAAEGPDEHQESQYVNGRCGA